MEKLKYFVYTSGEEHYGQVDWGAKFVSDDFTLPNGYEIDDNDSHESLIELSNAYTEIVARYGLSGGLIEHHPSGDGLGYIVLPWNEKYTLVGIYANFADLKKRANIGLVMASVPRDIRKSMSPREVINGLLKENDIRGIAAPRLNKEDAKDSPRPKRLLLDDSGTTDDMDPSLKVLEGVGWPNQKNAFILLDGKIKKFKSDDIKVKSAPVSKGKTGKRGKSGKGKIVLAVIVILLIGAAVSVFMPSGSNTVSDESAKIEEENAKREIENERKRLRRVADDVITKGNRSSVIGLALIERLGANNFKVLHKLVGKLPVGEGQEFDAEPYGSVNKSTADNNVVKLDDVRKKLTALLTKFKYSDDVRNEEPIYEMEPGKSFTQDDWKQTVKDFENLFKESNTGAADATESEHGENIDIDSDDIIKIIENKEAGERLQIAFFDSPQGVWQDVRVVTINGDDVSGDQYVLTSRDYVAITSGNSKKWCGRFEGKKQGRPWIEFNTANGGFLCLHGTLQGTDLKERAGDDPKKIYEVFIEDMLGELEKVNALKQ